jgi:hypothetical protein
VVAEVVATVLAAELAEPVVLVVVDLAQVRVQRGRLVQLIQVAVVVEGVIRVRRATVVTAAPVSSLFNTPLPHQPKQSASFHSQAVPYGYALLV